MTREELKAHCKKQIEMCEFWTHGKGEELNNNKIYQEHKLILELLEQESTDCVSRQFMYELGATCIATRNENGKLIALGAIDEMPSVTPQEPILDKIRAEIEERKRKGGYEPNRALAFNVCLTIIDKYKAESEGKE